MKLSIFMTILCLVPSLSQAKDPAMKAKRFEENKARILQNIDTRIGYINQFKSCVSGATSKDQMKSCRQDHKSKMQAFQAENKAKRQAWKKERAERKAAKKK